MYTLNRDSAFLLPRPLSSQQKMTNEQIQSRIDIAVELLEGVPVLALANHERLLKFVDDMPNHVRWLNARRDHGLADVYFAEEAASNAHLAGPPRFGGEPLGTGGWG